MRPVTTVETVAQFKLSPDAAADGGSPRWHRRVAVRLGAALRAPDASLLLDGPLGGWVCLQAIVRYRLAALDRDPVGAGREPLFGAADRGELITELGETTLGELVFVEPLRVAVTRFPARGSLERPVALERRDLALDACPLTVEKLACACVVHGCQAYLAYQ